MRHVQMMLSDALDERRLVRYARLGGEAAKLCGRKVQDDAKDLDEVWLQTSKSVRRRGWRA